MAYTLSLAQEFGGFAFGPFETGVVSLGSDAGRCQIVLHPSLGVRPVHAQVSFQGGQVVVQPVEMSGPVFFCSRDRAIGDRMRGAASLAVGDGFALVTANGPRFTLSIAQPVAPPPRPTGPLPGFPQPPGAHRLNAKSMQREVNRQVGAELHRLVPVSTFSKFAYQLKTGALFQPRYVVGALLALGSALVVGCGGVMTAVYAWMHR